jgi:hypothetical protein
VVEFQFEYSIIITWEKELYVNAYRYNTEEYTSYVCGKRINCAPEVIDVIFGFRHEEPCSSYGDRIKLVAKAWALWFIANFKTNSNTTEVIMSRCYAAYAIMKGEPIRVGRLISCSIKRMIDTPDRWAGSSLYYH